MTPSVPSEKPPSRESCSDLPMASHITQHRSTLGVPVTQKKVIHMTQARKYALKLTQYVITVYANQYGNI